MKKEDIKIGMKVRVRKYEDMKRDGKVDKWSDLVFPDGTEWDRDDECHIGKTGVVDSINNCSRFPIIVSFNDGEKEYYSPYALEPVEEDGLACGQSVNGSTEEQPKKEMRLIQAKVYEDEYGIRYHEGIITFDDGDYYTTEELEQLIKIGRRSLDRHKKLDF